MIAAGVIQSGRPSEESRIFLALRLAVRGESVDMFHVKHIEIADRFNVSRETLTGFPARMLSFIEAKFAFRAAFS